MKLGIPSTVLLVIYSLNQSNETLNNSKQRLLGEIYDKLSKSPWEEMQRNSGQVEKNQHSSYQLVNYSPSTMKCQLVKAEAGIKGK